MKNLLLSTVFLLSAVAQAQLYVAPNAGTDSYIYVKDQILYVEQDINLTANPTATEESSIYLRNEAQLIQGSTVSSNSGTGTISVFQNTPDSDSWDYTYWCSPVGNINATGNRSFGLARLNDSINLKSSNLALITNALNGIQSPLTISQKWIYRHPRGHEELGAYVYVGAGNTVPPGHGFTMKGVGTTNHDQLYDFRGRANNGTMVIPVFDGEWTLSGNPYPSAMDLNALFYDSENGEIVQFLYWDEDHGVNSHLYTQNRGGYGTYVPGAQDPGGTTENGTYVPPVFVEWNAVGGNPGGTGATGASYDRRFAPIGQGFMIEPDGTGDQMVHIKNSFRRYIKEGNASDFRSTEGPGLTNPNANKLPQFRFNTYFGESHGRQMVQLFSESATDQFDRGFDGKSPLDASSEVYFPIGEEGDALIPLVISTTKFEMDKMLPITIKVNDEQYDVQLEIIEMINFNQRVYLYDNVAKTYQPIYGGNKSSTLLNPGTYVGRFYLTFQNKQDSSAGVKELSDLAKSAIDFFQNNTARQLEISNPEGYDIQQASIFDMSGKLVYSAANLGKQTHLTFPTYNFSDGVYLVSLKTANNGMIDYKMNVVNK